ncbi:TPA: hypothetical protein ACHVKB_005435 [Bacillus cereus]
MELSKLEIAIVLGVFIQGLGDEVPNNYNANDLFKQLAEEMDKVFSNSTLNQIKESNESVIDKFICGLLEENNQEQKEPIPPCKK